MCVKFVCFCVCEREREKERGGGGERERYQGTSPAIKTQFRQPSVKDVLQSLLIDAQVPSFLGHLNAKEFWLTFTMPFSFCIMRGGGGLYFGGAGT